MLEAEQNLSGVGNIIYGHHASKESLEQSKRQGCVICSYLDDGTVGRLDQFGYCTAFIVEFLKQKDGTEFEMCFNYNDSLYGVAFAPYPRKLFSGKQRAFAITVAKDLLAGRVQFLHSNLLSSTEDPATLNIAQWWLSTCVATHEACAVTSKSSWVPTRLLKLDAANNTFKLVSQSDVEPGSRYTALSHCWGSKSWASNLILNSDNYATLCKQQPVAILPKTFRDAFTIIRQLNLQYLWIDRFCIYQDSRDDWQKESSIMHKVYRNSFLCISALSATDDDGGCFFTRDIEVVKPSILNFSKDGVSQPTLYTSYEQDNSSWQSAFKQEVLTSRAWVVQERLLAPRILHFGKDQIYWECNQEYRSETQPEHQWRRSRAILYTDFENVRTTWKGLIGAGMIHQPGPTVVALRAEWFGILSFYSSCKLSQEEDKLVAISAIVKDMKRHLEGLGKSTDYFAGIWRLWLPQSLLWWTKPETAQKHRPRQYRAPSWSWASVDSTVSSREYTHFSNNGGWVASVASVEVTHLTDDDTGQVVSGVLTLRGKLVRVLLERLTGYWDKRYLVGLWGVRGFETVQGDPFECNFYERRSASGPRIVFDTEEDVSECVLFLPIYVGIYPDSRAFFYRGLLLASSGRDHRRVGYMDITLCGALEDIEDYEVRIV